MLHVRPVRLYRRILRARSEVTGGRLVIRRIIRRPSPEEEVMARPVVFGGGEIRIATTPEHAALVERECALTGASKSEVVRRALAAYFATPPKKRARR